MFGLEEGVKLQFCAFMQALGYQASPRVAHADWSNTLFLVP